MLIGLTGMREAGKSTFAKIAVDIMGFKSIHAFGPGKAMIMAYYTYIGIDEATAYEMVHGKDKDTYLGNLPDEKNSRFFMEEIGRFMGEELGPQWTALQELKKTEREHPGCNCILESIVYELPILQHREDALIIKVERPGHKGPEGTFTDAHVSSIQPFMTIINGNLLEYGHKCALLLRSLIENQHDFNVVKRHFGEVF